MCGLAGALAFKNSSFAVTEPFINLMRDAMSHRGPDGADTWISEDGRIGLGHRRLSIIDLSDAATQPMSNEDGSLWVVFNGEIYNHAAVRAELEAIGKHRWQTSHSDTEVILHAFEQWGIGCLEKFRGMFAIALWDTRARELWLIRDRIGIKPLYYSRRGDRLIFASEIKALLRDPDQKRALNEESFYDYLSFLTTPAPDTLFHGIRKLPNATWLRVSEDGRVKEQRYWEVWDHTAPLSGLDEAEIAGRLIAGLREAVKLHKVSDVPVGVFLSGGIDSSANAALFSEDEGNPVKTFTIGYEGNYRTYRNEMEYARLIAGRIKADHYERLLTLDDLIGFLPQMVYHQDEPIADPVCVPNYYVSKLARENGVTVCQVGEGADELFWGYPSWKTLLRLQALNDLPAPRFLKRAGLAGLRLIGKEKTCYYEWLRRGSEGLPISWSGTECFTGPQKKALLSPRLRRQFSGRTAWDAVRPIRERFTEKAWEKSPLNWMTYVDLNLRLPELLLMRMDKMSMAVALEGRVPFLDHKFVELAMSIPQAVKTKHGTLKYILKNAVRGLIPDELINRKKQGFAVPVSEWLFDRLGDKIIREVSDLCRETDLLDRDEAVRLVQEGRDHKSWQLLNFALWYKEYLR